MSYKIVFIDFFVDFSYFARTAENPFIEPLMDYRNNEKEIRNVRRSLVVM